MKWMIASDIHGSARFCRELLAAYEREQAERLVLLGDLLYHGPRNDLPEGYAPKEVLAMLNSVKEELLCVRGNCDTEVDQMVLQFPILADYAVFCLGGRTVYATHGHHFNPQTPPPLKKGDVLLNGHTHVPKCEAFGEARNFLYLNPGSVSIPKEDSPRGYILWEGGTLYFRTLAGETWRQVTAEEMDGMLSPGN